MRSVLATALVAVAVLTGCSHREASYRVEYVTMENERGVPVALKCTDGRPVARVVMED